MIDSTGLKVFGEGELKVKKHVKERRRIWRKLYLAVGINTQSEEHRFVDDTAARADFHYNTIKINNGIL